MMMRVGDGQSVFESLQKCGVIVRPMEGYGLKEWIRISVGTKDENRRTANALKSVLS